LVSQLNKYLGSQGTLTDIASMSITGKTSSGSVAQLTVIDSVGTPRVINVRPKSRWIAGELDITPDNIRSLLGKSSLIPVANSGFNGSTYLTAITNGSSTTPASTSTKAPKLVSVTGNAWPKRLTLGSDYKVSGTISPVQSGVRVTLQRQLSTGWTALDTTVTDASGKWTVNWKTPKAGKYILRAEAANSRNAVHGNNHPVTVAAIATLAAPKVATHNAAMRLTGQVSPAYTNASVIVERKTAAGTWKQYCASKTDATGKWRATPKAPKLPGTLTLRARIVNNALGNPISTSVSIAVR
jgi:hypothetical protein